MMNKTIESPVLFDANVLMNFRGQLKLLFSFFDEILIHKQVYDEVVSESIRQEIQTLITKGTRINIVVENIPEGSVEQSLFKSCDSELKSSFNIYNSRDLGEYKSLLYAKFHNVGMFSSQDTTVWAFVSKSLLFNDVECITMQDLAYLIYLNGINGKDRKLGKDLYKHYSKKHDYPWEWFKKYMERNDNNVPNYIAYEMNRIDNYHLLLDSYISEYCSVYYCTSNHVENQLIETACDNPNTCLSCIYSRLNEQDKGYLQRVCSLRFEFEKDECEGFSEHFTTKVNKRLK